MNVLRNIRNELQKQGYLTILIAVNLAVFLGINLSLNLRHTDTLLGFIAMPLDAEVLAMRFWTPVTYMFMQLSFGHLLSNMLLLFFTGRLFTSIFPEKKLVYVYIMSGLFAGLFMFIIALFVPAFSGTFLLGSSAAILGLVCCIAGHSPNLEVSLFMVLRLKYKYIALILVAGFSLLDVSINPGGKLSHVAGALFGLGYGCLLQRGRDLSALSFTRKQSPLKVVHKRAVNDDEYNGQRAENQKILDALLDKISKSGYDSLSRSEKETLFKLSQKK